MWDLRLRLLGSVRNIGLDRSPIELPLIPATKPCHVDIHIDVGSAH